MVLLQLYAVAPLLSRSFSGHAGVLRCSGDHAQCGCSAARIASQTCCCFQSKQLLKSPPLSPLKTSDGPAAASAGHIGQHGAAAQPGEKDADASKCCPPKNSTVQTVTSPVNDLARNPDNGTVKPRSRDAQGRLLPVLCAVPCGSDPVVISTALDNLKFLGSSTTFAAPAALTAAYPISRPDLFPDRFPEPPDPPPRLSLLS